MIYLICLFVLGVIFLVKGADYLIRGAKSLAHHLRVSDWMIGLTVVAFGGSLPEFVVNIYAVSHDSPAIAVSNILGSVSANICLVLGVSAMIYSLSVSSRVMTRDIPLSILATLAIGFLVFGLDSLNNEAWLLSRGDAVILLFGFVLLLFYFIRSEPERISDHDSHPPELKKSILWVVLGLVGIALGAQWIVDSAKQIALRLGVSSSLVGFTVVAMGTSLPELAASAMAAYRKNADIAIANVIGSNIFNFLFVLASSAMVQPLPFSVIDLRDWLITIVLTLMFVVFLFLGKKWILSKVEGLLLVGTYMLYIFYIVRLDMGF